MVLQPHPLAFVGLTLVGFGLCFFCVLDVLILVRFGLWLFYVLALC
jgi:hypothetical protein